MNHLFAIAFAAVAALVTWVAFKADSTTIICVGCFGILLGYLIYGFYNAPNLVLMRRFKKLGCLQGRTLEEIERVVGPHDDSQPVRLIDRNNEPGMILTWSKNGYTIKLGFDSRDICYGVTFEESV